MKTCSKCKESKELICFCKDKSRPDGFNNQCKKCKTEKDRKYQQANAEKVADYHRKYQQANPEKVAEFHRKYRQANAEKVAEKKRKYQQANTEKFAEKSRKYRQANAEKCADYQRKYQQKQKQEQAANLFFQMAHFASEITKTTITP